ncbi:MAG TPA: serine/threonine-protein kinase, partial [Candidatus Sulfopaludibacter sp.]|nr:serine/threonine-protein kinase [Candidatus Sulfopaludibacter sp.]
MAAPSRVGRYEIVRQIGKSMTDVYLAIDTVENRKAALKLVPAGGDAASQLVMEAERRGAAIQKELQRLDPRMVEVYDIGDEDGYFFVAMQYVEGRSLSEVLRADGAVDPNRAAVIALEVCEQLAKFHSWQSTVVHGDIKPSNVHLGPNDTVRLLDFGIAKTLRANCDDTTHHFGSPGYCSPERLARSAVDQQSDLWAVGATLYEMLAGHPPYQAESTRKLENLIRSKRAPRALPSTCPKGLRLIVAKALSPEAEQRYQSALEFQADLQAFLERRSTVAELERGGWSPNATIEAAREYLRKATRTIARVKRAVKIAGAAGWFAAGMALWIGGSIAWQEWQGREAARKAAAAAKVAAPQPSPPPVLSRDEEMRALYAHEGEAILAAWRASSDPSLHHFDWQKAEVCLDRAVQLGASDDRTVGELAVSKGFATLQRLEGGRYSEEAAAQLRLYARDQFRTAAVKMPGSPEPHFALARVYVYALPNVDEAMAEFTAAQELGGKPGRRELEQQGDVFRERAIAEVASNPKQARADAARARAFYESVRGYDEVDAHLREVARLEKAAPPPRRKT